MRREGMRQIAIIGVFAVLTQTGCSGFTSHRVKYQPFVKQKIPSTDQAVSMSGSYGEAKALFEKAQLPHNNPRQKYELTLEGIGKLTDQLGSDDYVLIGEVRGGGSSRASQTTLAKAMCKKAAKKGGNVVMIFKQEIVEQAYSYTTPGFSITNINANVYGNTVYGQANTTHIPGQTYSGIHHKPVASGLVFRHVPGVGAERKRLLQADDKHLSKAVPALERLAGNKKLSWEEALRQWQRIISDAVEATTLLSESIIQTKALMNK